MTQPEAARVVGVSAKTVQRRLNRSLVLLGECLGGRASRSRRAPSAAAGARVFEGAYADGRESAADHV